MQPEQSRRFTKHPPGKIHFWAQCSSKDFLHNHFKKKLCFLCSDFWQSCCFKIEKCIKKQSWDIEVIPTAAMLGNLGGTFWHWYFSSKAKLKLFLAKYSKTNKKCAQLKTLNVKPFHHIRKTDTNLLSKMYFPDLYIGTPLQRASSVQRCQPENLCSFS